MLERVAVIMCGGSGQRLWPLSTPMVPKQFLKLFDGKSLLELTIDRIKSSILKFDAILFVTNGTYFSQIQEASSKIKIKKYFLLEKESYNTAAVIALACAFFNSIKVDAHLLFFPSDHYFSDQKSFDYVMMQALEISHDSIILFGVTPTYPETQYGYIKAVQIKPSEEYIVTNFIEKPSAAILKQLILSENYFWNVGIFMSDAKIFNRNLSKYYPALVKVCEELLSTAQWQSPGCMQIMENFPTYIDKVSFDKAILEKCTDVKMVAFSTVWSDVGNWGTLAKLLGNMDHSKQENIFYHETVDTFVYSQEKPTAVVGLKNVTVVGTKDGFLVCNNDYLPYVKNVSAYFSNVSKKENITYKPWGYYETYIQSAHYLVKKICVNAGKRLSLQRHLHRSEHWVIVAGKARVTVALQEKYMHVGEAIVIPMGEIHRLENVGENHLEIIETQLGNLISEEDIERIEDDYDRVLV